MKHRPRFVVHSGPIVPRSAEPGQRRLIEVAGETRELSSFRPAPGETLEWKQQRVLRGVWWLESGRGTHLMLHIPGSVFRTPRTCPVESATGSWTLGLGWGWGGHRIPVRDTQGAEVMHHEQNLLGRGRVTLANGELLSWRRHWSAFGLRDANDHELLVTRRTFAWFRLEGTVTLTDAARGRDDLMPLLALNWLAALESRRHAR